MVSDFSLQKKAMQRGLEGFLLRATASRSNCFGQTSIMPYLPIILSNGNQTREVMGLLDTGASVNVLPYEIGLELGAVWEEQCDSFSTKILKIRGTS